MAVIFAADAASYGSLMQQDEEGTYLSLRSVLEGVYLPSLLEHHGRLIKTSGDGLLAEFRSLVEAVHCAVAVQQKLKAGESNRAAALQFRIGINLGDVIAENGDIFGEGVNVAARLEQMAAPGDILISSSVYEHVQGRVPYALQSLGARPGKPNERPIRAYRVCWSHKPPSRASRPQRKGEGRPAIEKPRIAVLHFANLGGDSEREYFSHGLTEDIIRLLGRNRWLDVLSRHSTHDFLARDVDPREVGAALGARYLVQGSVRIHDERVQIAVELVETEAGRQLWSEAYDLGLVDIFDIQASMAGQIAAAIEPELGRIEQQAAARKPPESLHAWDCYQRGYWHLWGFTAPGFAEAAVLFRRAIEFEPGLARAHAGLAYVQMQKALYSDPPDRPVLLSEALTIARAAVALDNADSHCHYVLGRVHCLLRDPDASIAELEHTIALNPSFAQGYFGLAFTLVWCRREEESIALLERAVELSPRDPHLWTFHHIRAMAHFALGELQSAEFFAREAVRQPSATYFAHTGLVATLGLDGRLNEAGSALAQLRTIKPVYSLALAAADFSYCTNQELQERFLKGLRLAGVPD